LDETGRYGDSQGRILQRQGGAGTVRPDLSQKPSMALRIAKIEPGREEVIRAYGKTIEETIAGAQLLVPIYNAFLLSVPKSGFCFLWGKCRAR
jgi:hypothetical protein